MRVGIFGGTFDPPHIAHLILAAEAADQLALDCVLWVVTPDPPHKLGRVVTPLELRLPMVQAAIDGQPSFRISRVEIDRPGPHYSVDTVALLAQEFPQAQLWYLMGGDSLRDLPTWMRPLDFLDGLAGVGVMRRPQDAIDLAGLEQVLPGINNKAAFVDTPLLQISSTDIRERVAAGRQYRFFVPPPVYAWVEQHGLYRQPQPRVDAPAHNR